MATLMPLRMFLPRLALSPVSGPTKASLTEAAGAAVVDVLLEDLLLPQAAATSASAPTSAAIRMSRTFRSDIWFSPPLFADCGGSIGPGPRPSAAPSSTQDQNHSPNRCTPRALGRLRAFAGNQASSR